MLTLSEKDLRFGKISTNITHPFQVIVTNESDQDITPTLDASCGCTVPNLTPATIPAKGTAILSGIFDTTGKLGYQHKRVYLIYMDNSAVTPIRTTTVLDFYAEVLNTLES